MTLHKRTFYNHRVVVVLHDGERIEGRYLKTGSRFVVIKLPDGTKRKVLTRDMRSMGPVTVSAIGREAAASVALDRDERAHTCYERCQEYPECPGRKHDSTR